MSTRILSERNVKHARKDYPCDACYILLQEYGKLQLFINENSWRLSTQELQILRDIERNGFKIKKGEPYLRIAGVFDGEFNEFKANKQIHDICLKYNVYEDE